jgi:hypothetical protein
MVEAWPAQAERRARESGVSLASTRGESNEVARKVTLLEAQDMGEAKLPGYANRAVDVDRRQMRLRGSVRP